MAFIFAKGIHFSFIFCDWLCALYILVALVEEVYFAQKERDKAVMSRLQLAIEERDEAIARAKHMEMSLNMYVHFENSVWY